MNDQSVRALLERAADVAGDQFLRPTVEGFRSRQRSVHRRAGGIIASVAVVVLAAAVSVVLTRAGSPTHRPATNRLPTVGQLTAEQLGRYHWSALPAAPIAARADAVSVWTGTQMLVWGGSSSGKMYVDGAAYSPATRTWQTMPPAPLSPRQHPFAVWSGTRMIIWGGTSGQTQLSDGAMYDPSSRQWTTMATARPLNDHGQRDFLWAGGFAVRLSLNEIIAANRLRVDAFDPTTNTWTTLPSIRLPLKNLETALTATVINHRLVVWISDVGSFALNPTRSTWTRAPYSPSSAGCIYRVITTATGIIYPAEPASRTCGGDLSGAPGARGSELDLATRTTRAIAYTPTTDAGCITIWTGAALLNTNTYPSHRTGVHTQAGQTTAWDPVTNTWTTIQTEPGMSRSATWVWTGTQLIGFGTFGRFHPGPAGMAGLIFTD